MYEKSSLPIDGHGISTTRSSPNSSAPTDVTSAATSSSLIVAG